MKSKQTKRALVSSALALVLCFVMLLGTTFAWFTDNASTSVNKVQAGKLDVALEMADGQNTDGSTKWVSAEGETLDFVKATGAAENEAVLWEPGCTYSLPDLRIVNKGNLALKYEVYLTVTGDTTLGKVIDVTAKDENNNSLFKGRDNTGAEITLNTMTLSDVLAAAKLPSDINNKTANAAIKGELAGGADTGAISISMTMQSSAGNTYQGETIEGIAVTVVATQDTVEYDSATYQYDKGAEYAEPITAAELRKLFVDDDGKTKGSVTLTKDYVLVDEWDPITNNNEAANDVVIDGGGHSIFGLTVSEGKVYNRNSDTACGFFAINTKSLTIKNLTFVNANIKADSSYVAVVVGIARGTVTMENVHVVNSSVQSTADEGIRVGGLIGMANLNGNDITKLTLKNCSVEGTQLAGYHNVSGLIGTLMNYKNEDNLARYSVSDCAVKNCAFTWRSSNWSGDNNYAFAVGATTTNQYNTLPTSSSITNLTVEGCTESYPQTS